VDFGDGVSLDVSRFDLDRSERIGTLEQGEWITRFAKGADGQIFALAPGWSPRILRFDADGQLAASISLPDDPDWELADLALAPDRSIWLVDNRGLEVHHISAVGDHLATWRFYDALRSGGDGGYRIALAPDGQSLWLLSWARLFRFSLDGRLMSVVGAPQFELGPEDFVAPMDLAVDGAGRAYVLEGTGRMRVFEPDGWEAARWQTFDPPEDAGDWQQAALALGPEDQIAVADLRHGRLHFFDPLSTARTTPIERGPYRAHLPLSGLERP
jgi:hypothetical protein